jgi:hypothetical protein
VDDNLEAHEYMDDVVRLGGWVGVFAGCVMNSLL